MQASMNALLWEQWRRTRWALLAVFAASTVVTLYCFISPNLPKDYQTPPELSRDFRSFAMILYMLVLFLPLDGSDIKLGLPRYMMTLPCRTSILAKAQLRYGLLSALLLVVANEAVAACFVGNQNFELALLAVSLLAILYALFWTFGIVAPRPTLFAAAATAVTVVYFHNLWEKASLFFLPAEAVAAIIGVFLAVWGIYRDRNGELAPGVFERNEESPSAFLWRLAHEFGFTAPPGLKPLFLYEWKRTYRYIPIISVPAVVVCCLALPGLDGLSYHARFRNTQLFEHLTYTSLAIPLLVCGIIGLLRDTWEYRDFRAGPGLSEYCRPVSDRRLVAARWLAGAAGISLTELPLLLILLASGVFLGEIRIPVAATSLIFVPIAYITLSWILLWISPLVLLAALVILGDIPHTLTLILLCGIAGLGLFGIVPVAIRRGAISSRWVLFSLLCWTVVYAVLYGSLVRPLDSLPDEVLIAIGMVAVIACLTFVWTPLTVHGMRHRS
ncbi:MAG: hypothetical protein HZB26_03610 [Candidatus Hydrogenedentes bacterium]|nr:hypothetical protein [Candidatus Hydrogenedentota bacterium]